MTEELSENEICDGLKAYRTLKAKLSQKEASQKAGISQATLSYVERGLYDESHVSNLIKAYGLEKSEFEDWVKRYLELMSA